MFDKKEILAMWEAVTSTKEDEHMEKVEKLIKEVENGKLSAQEELEFELMYGMKQIIDHSEMRNNLGLLIDHIIKVEKRSDK